MDFEHLFLAVIPYIMLACAIPFHVVVIMCMRELIRDKGFNTYFCIFVYAIFLVAYDVILAARVLGIMLS
jgi:hypothetical protein